MSPAKRNTFQPSLFDQGAAELPDKLCIVVGSDALAALTQALRASPQVGLAVAGFEDDIAGLALQTHDGAGLRGWYIALGEDETDRAALATALSSALDDVPRLIAHDVKAQLHQLARLGIRFQCGLFDTQIAAHLCNTPFGELSLPSCAKLKLGVEIEHIEDFIGSGRRAVPLVHMPAHKVAPHFCRRAEIAWQLAAWLEPQLRAMNQTALFETCEMPLLWTLFDMESAGVAVDVPYLRALSDELGQQIAQLEQRIFTLAGHDFNVGSIQQLSQVLFDELELPQDKLHRTWRGGNVSTSAWSLEEIKDKHPIIPLVLDHRELAKLKGTYADALPELIRAETGRLHTTFNQVNTVTGRLSSTNPNLQNVPITSELGRRVRKAFIAREGGVVISADYSQVELRILAHLADDPGLQAAFQRGEDIHASTAATIYGVPLVQVNDEQRGHAKRINFGLAYGMGWRSLAHSTGLSDEQAQAFVARYFRAYPNLQRWLNQIKREAARTGYVETILGRRRYLPRLLPDSGVSAERRSRAEREAINTPVQGSAADIMKLAMIKLQQRLKREGYAARMTLQVHDEVVVDCPREEAEAVKQVVCEELANAYPLRAPLAAAVGCGPNWDETV